MTSKISRLFLKALSVDSKYSLLERDDLTEPIEMQLSWKQNTFGDVFSAFLKSTLNFEYSKSNMVNAHKNC